MEFLAEPSAIAGGSFCLGNQPNRGKRCNWTNESDSITIFQICQSVCFSKRLPLLVAPSSTALISDVTGDNADVTSITSDTVAGYPRSMA